MRSLVVVVVAEQEELSVRIGLCGWELDAALGVEVVVVVLVQIRRMVLLSRIRSQWMAGFVRVGR